MNDLSVRYAQLQPRIELKLLPHLIPDLVKEVAGPRGPAWFLYGLPVLTSVPGVCSCCPGA